MTIQRPNINFRTRQVVLHEASTEPYVGFEHLEGDRQPGGWLYDIKRWCSTFDLRVPTMPRLADASTQGLSETEYFQQGVGDIDLGDLYVKQLDETFLNHERHWLPHVLHGWYYRYKWPYFYYGDNSRVQNINPTDNRSGRNYLELEATPDVTSPISAAKFKRHPINRAASYYIRVQQTHAFTGTYTDGEEQETVSPLGKINWSNVDYTKKEFIIDSTIDGTTLLRFNRNFVEQHGVIPTVFNDLGACECLGASTGADYQLFHLKYFPVLADASFHLYVADITDNTWEEWTRVDTWWELLNLDPPAGGIYQTTKYFVDKDLGIVYFGSGNDGGVPDVGKYIVATYRSTLRVEYEELERPTNTIASNADVNPVAQSVDQGFVLITHQQLEPASITLEIDKAPIPFVSPLEYGPIVVGADYALLRAHVVDSNGIDIPGIEVGFTMDPTTVGYLGGSTATNGTTNAEGHAYATYQPPTSADDMGFYSTIVRDSTHPLYLSTHRDIIIRHSDIGWEDRETDIYLYHVLKDDVLQGYSTLDSFLYNAIGYPDWVQDATDYAQWKTEMILNLGLREWSGLVDNKLAGRKVIVYKLDYSANDATGGNWDSNAIQAETGNSPAMVPLRPNLVEQITDTDDEYYGLWRLIYPKDAIPLCDPDDPTFTIGGYWAIASRVVTFQAHCWSSYYNKIIYSNEITTRVSLPQYLLGEYIVNNITKIPYGWKIISDLDNVAAGLDGATFLTINPHSGPYRILDHITGTTPTDWADAPFKSVGFQIRVVT